jgi:ribosomal protein S18 acetylase RimI-like enzyme
MPIREIKLPQDLQAIADLATTSFQYPENPEWSIQEDEAEGLVNSIKNLQRLWPLINLLKIFSPTLRDIFIGHIWEEEGNPAGLVIIQRRGSTDKWYIGTVAVHPDFRRRGIARKLVEASLDLMRNRGGKIALLDVISGNLPAYNLYKDIGFEHFSSNIDLERSSKAYPEEPTLPEGYYQDKLKFSDWQSRYQLEERIIPEHITRYEPVEIGRFKRSWAIRLIIPLFIRAQGVRMLDFIIKLKESGQVVGRANIDLRTRSGGRHSVLVRLDPNYAHLTGYIFDFLLHQATQSKREHFTETTIPQWQPHLIEAAKDAGFEERLEFHRLGLVL